MPEPYWKTSFPGEGSIGGRVLLRLCVHCSGCMIVLLNHSNIGRRSEDGALMLFLMP